MSTDTREGADDLEERVSNFLMRNFPQIAMHGGSAAVRKIDRETGEVWISLGGACSGCGISPMTVQAIKSRMPMEIPEITEVHADAGGFDSMMPSFPEESSDRGGESRFPDAPF